MNFRFYFDVTKVSSLEILLLRCLVIALPLREKKSRNRFYDDNQNPRTHCWQNHEKKRRRVRVSRKTKWRVELNMKKLSFHFRIMMFVFYLFASRALFKHQALLMDILKLRHKIFLIKIQFNDKANLKQFKSSSETWLGIHLFSTYSRLLSVFAVSGGKCCESPSNYGSIAKQFHFRWF